MVNCKVEVLGSIHVTGQICQLITKPTVLNNFITIQMYLTNSDPAYAYLSIFLMYLFIGFTVQYLK